MSPQPTVRVINGSGKPRLMVVQKTPFYQSVGTTTYDAVSVTEAESGSKAIASSSVANPSVIAATAHGKLQGQWIRISGHIGSVPDINGKWLVLDVPDVDHLTIGANVTTGGTGGTLITTPAFAQRGFGVGRRIAVEPSPTSADRLRYGKIVGIDDALNKLTVDAWIGGTPSNGAQFKSDGWIADLPFTKNEGLTERFAPLVLVHPVWEDRKLTKHRGFDYECVLDYAEGFYGDLLLLLRPHLNMGREDRLVLIPHVDQPGFSYNVYFAEKLELGQFGLGIAHKKMVLVFAGKEKVSSFPIIAGYGSNYANDYGNGL